MNVAAIVQRRLSGQMLTRPGPGRASEVVRALGAVQAQDYAGAKWALSQRTRTLATDADIERELADGRILRTHVLRPTWHFVVPGDIRWMLALTAPRVNQAMAYYNRQLELTPTVFRRSRTAITKALAGDQHLTRTQLKAALERARIGKISGQRLGHLVMQAELDAVIASGPRRGKQFTYALLDERVPPSPTLDRDAALLELTRRYFATRGPASAHDFAWWSGLTLADVKRGIEIAARELERVDVEEKQYWVSVSAASVPKPKASAHLLPNYDEYFIGYKDRSAIGQRIGDVRRVTGGNALIAHAAFINGQLVGGWKRLMGKSAVIVRLELLVRVTTTERALLTREAHRFSHFLDAPVEIREVAA